LTPVLGQKVTLQQVPRFLAGNAIFAFRVRPSVGGDGSDNDRRARNAIEQTHGHRGSRRHDWRYVRRQYAAQTGNAWLAELVGSDKARATIISTGTNFLGLAFGPLIAGLLAQYAI
jgi:hypothetical protein